MKHPRVLNRFFEVFPDKEHFGRIFYNMASLDCLSSRAKSDAFNQAQMSALNIPQIAVVHGISVAGM